MTKNLKDFKRINLYIHIPFCLERCKYCKFASFDFKSKKQVHKYIINLCKEIESKKDIYILDTIYIGGGTPSLLGQDNLEQLFNSIKANFLINKNIEITIESNPINITEGNLLLWKNLGINRISIGVQTLNEKSINTIGRTNKGNIFEALDLINNFQFKKNFVIGLDFIIGLPYVSKGEIKSDIYKIIKKYDFIDHFSVYFLEGGMKSWKKNSINENDFLFEYIQIKYFLKLNGYKNYEISNYAKIGKESKHNSGYWNHKEYLGLGLGAHSFINNTRFFNSKNLNDYYLLKNFGTEKLTSEEILIEKLMFLLRTSGIEKKYLHLLDKNKLSFFIENSYLSKEGNKIKLTDKGVLVLDYILREII